MNDSNYISPALYVDGEWIAETGRSMPIMNPATGKQIGTLPLADAKLVDRALASANRGFAIWSKTPHDERTAIIYLCNPTNPQGAFADVRDGLAARVRAVAERYPLYADLGAPATV